LTFFFICNKPWLADKKGYLYGTTFNGGTWNYGSVFELTGTGFVPF